MLGDLWHLISDRQYHRPNHGRSPVLFGIPVAIFHLRCWRSAGGPGGVDLDAKGGSCWGDIHREIPDEAERSLGRYCFPRGIELELCAWLGKDERACISRGDSCCNNVL